MNDQDSLVAWVGAYGGGDPAVGGISVLNIARDGDTVTLTQAGRTTTPQEAGYLAHAPATGMLYAVDERKTDGRGPVGPAAAVHAFAVDPADGTLTAAGSLASPGPFPTYLAVDEDRGLLYSANHGSFEHTEAVVRHDDGSWGVEYRYDDSTVVLYRLAGDGRLEQVLDVHVCQGHGTDPNHSLQAGGHGQSGAHAHSAVIDPSGRWLLVGDKGTDQILVFRTGDTLTLAGAYQAEAETGPRHIAFDPATARAYVTYEFSSELVCFDFDQDTGTLALVGRTGTTGGTVERTNEPADVRVHPAGRIVYVNNRGEDTLAWFAIDEAGSPTRTGSVRLADSIHPGLAARSFAFSPDGDLLLVADRPAGLVRAYRADPTTGDLAPVAEAPVAEPAFVTLAALH